MKQSFIIALLVLSILGANENNDSNETLENNKSITDKASDLVEETKESATKLVEVIRTKTHELLDSNATIPIDAEALYKKCAGCHGSDGKTKALNKSLIIAGADSNTTLSKLQGYQKGELDIAGMGRLMTTQVDGLSLEELQALATYIQQMQP